MNIVNRLRFVADAHADKPAIVTIEEELTYSDLYDRVDRYAAALGDLGIGADDRFALLMGNSTRMLSLILAGWQVGATAAPVNVRLGDDTIEFLVDDAEAGTVVVDESRSDLLSVAQGIEGVDALTSGPDGDIESHLPASADPGVTPRLDDELALLLHTAGTTGRPKWVKHTNHTLSGSVGVAVGRKVGPEDRNLHYFPFYHSGGIDMTLSRLSCGGTVVVGSGWDAGEALELVERESVMGMDLVPQMGYEFVHHDDVDEYDLSSLEYIFVGADTVSEELAGEFRDLGAQPVQAYGLTETMAVIAITEFGDTDAPLDSTGNVIGDLARAKIVDPDTGEELPAGEIGEIMLTGDKLTPGYHNRPEREAEVFEEGWIHTEDLGLFDDEGYLHITGRLDNMMIVGGENVYPTDVEETLKEHPAVSQAVVVSIPDERKSEVPVANVVLEDGEELSEDELKQWFIDRDAAFKHPRHVRFMQRLPTTPIGKIDRVSITEQVESEVGSGVGD
jgi:acyl-CoA synthetase (AMP-forming)/AMP-acid ligase II